MRRRKMPSSSVVLKPQDFGAPRLTHMGVSIVMEDPQIPKMDGL